MVLNSSVAPATNAQAPSITEDPLDLSKAGERLPARAIRAYVVRRARVECLDGELWVTGPGIGDEVLLPGESISFSKPGKVVVQALVAARLRIRASA